MDEEFDWLLVNARVPKEPSRHRVAVWRALRKTGAVPISSGMWAAPKLPVMEQGIDGARVLAERGGGTLGVFVVTRGSGSDTDLLREAFIGARRDEWTELIAECGKFEVEIRKEIETDKLTFAELEEEEQSLERLQRWFAELEARSVVALDEQAIAAQQLVICQSVLEGYADLVYRAAELGTGPQIVVDDEDAIGR
ncbi:Chromate resistance protein ChrB [Amnibacterium flavum]|uniref:Chromate resistance protein ChrB n=1 Tax=Amnibacterium flavum TaxID=2173173 RepID=A0A2V1HVV0_9MICO|nr:Chromate resistance protein ChrB [Amnibacterium flavum]PVZ95180.1 chromate resistance protein ChrB [Amnibacterium flavum]